MTCIVGFSDRENGISWLGGDSCSSNGYTQTTNAIPKVFRNPKYPNVLMGGTGTWRHLDLLRYSEDLFTEAEILKDTEINHEFMVTKFVPRLISLFNRGVVSEKDTDRGAPFIVAFKDRLFVVQSDFSVLEPKDGFCAVGSGEAYAEGALFALAKTDFLPTEKVIKALEAAESYGCGVRRPFKLLCTNGEELD